MQSIFLAVLTILRLIGAVCQFNAIYPFSLGSKLTTWRLEQCYQFDTDHVIMCHSTYKLLWADAISSSPVRNWFFFFVIAQRKAKDNLSLNLISTQRWWALFWLAWLVVCIYLGHLWPTAIPRAASVCKSVCVCVCVCVCVWCVSV